MGLVFFVFFFFWGGGWNSEHFCLLGTRFAAKDSLGCFNGAACGSRTTASTSTLQLLLVSAGLRSVSRGNLTPILLVLVASGSEMCGLNLNVQKMQETGSDNPESFANSASLQICRVHGLPNV